MYRKWPAGAAVGENPVVRNFFPSRMGKREEELKKSSPGHPMALSNRAWGGVPGRLCRAAAYLVSH